MKIAVIGTGIAGNTAAWLLHPHFDITVYEQNDYIGGHSNTVAAAGHPAIDTGFIVYNEWTYPNLIALFDHLGVETVATDMSFAASLDHGDLEYSGDALFAQKSNLFKPSFHRMWLDILRFYKEAPNFVKQPGEEDLSLGDYLRRHKYSRAFTENHILPMAAAIWSTAAQDVRDFPAKSFIRFFKNHGLLLLKNRPQWFTVQGGSRRYVEKLTAPFKDKIKLGTSVTRVHRAGQQVEVTDESGETASYDHVIMATHSDQALTLLRDAASAEERAVLGTIPYTGNIAYLHTDPALMPRRRKVWSSWNYMRAGADSDVCVTYWMNKLQPFIGTDQDYFVTLNAPEPPRDEHILRTIPYAHPLYTPQAPQGWDGIGRIQGADKIWYCGAWCGYGFHEDGISSGLAAAESLAAAAGRPVTRPWSVQDKSPAGHNARPHAGATSSKAGAA